MSQYDYDVIIIGAGIGGLVCGCYLAKAGMKVLIVEKNAKPGGYCTSFTRNGFKFDACAHSLGSLREGGNISSVLKELDIDKRIIFTRSDPQDVIITSEGQISFWNDLDKTISEFQSKFSQESIAIKRFFEFLNNCSGIAFNSLRRITFQVLLDEYFQDYKLKATLSFLMLGNSGLSASRVSASTAVTIYKEFTLDGGYYPKGGMQALPDIFLKRFKEFKGDILLSSFVTKIGVKDYCAKEVEVNGSNFISAKYLVSNVDAMQTFIDLIGENNTGKNILDALHHLHPSLSMFILYLGIDNSFKNIPGESNLWFLPHYDVEEMYRSVERGAIENLDWFLIRVLPDKKSMLMLVNSPFKDSSYWKENKKHLSNCFIKRVERIIPDLHRYVIFKDAATPDTLYRWTLNYKGAAYGWAGEPSQFAISDISQITGIKNLYLTGHWSTLVQGIPGVAYSGRDTAKMILKKEEKE